MKDILLVALGGVLGVNTRYLIYKKLKKLTLGSNLIILILNTSSSFSLGFLFSFIRRTFYLGSSSQLMLFFLIGFLGSLSTFSAFIYDLFDLLLEFKFLRAFQLFSISLVFGVVALVIGLRLGE